MSLALAARRVCGALCRRRRLHRRRSFRRCGRCDRNWPPHRHRRGRRVARPTAPPPSPLATDRCLLPGPLPACPARTRGCSLASLEWHYRDHRRQHPNPTARSCSLRTLQHRQNTSAFLFPPGSPSLGREGQGHYLCPAPMLTYCESALTLRT